MVVCWSIQCRSFTGVIQCRSFTGVIQCRSYTLSHTDHTLSHTPSFSHSPFEAIDWMIYFVIPETPSLTHLHSLSLILSLPWCPTTTMSHGVLLSPSVLSQLVLSFTFIPHPQVIPLSVLSHSRSPNHHTSHHSFHQSLSHGVHYLCSHRYPSYTSHLTWCPTTHRVIPALLTECSLTLHGVVLPPTHSHVIPDVLTE